jgi:hypothetical protein
MNAPLKALEEERDYLKTLVFKAMNQTLPFTVQIDGMGLPDTVSGKARFGITNYITMRLREIEEAIRELKKENNA